MPRGIVKELVVVVVVEVVVYTYNEGLRGTIRNDLERPQWRKFCKNRESVSGEITLENGETYSSGTSTIDFFFFHCIVTAMSIGINACKIAGN
jgi:hypothetical protein